jgi:hypothetical protein
MTPSSTILPQTSAIETHQCGTSRAKFAVPSMGSITQRCSPLLRAPSSPTKTVAGKRRREPLDDEALDRGIGSGDDVLRALDRDVEPRRIGEKAAGERTCVTRRRHRNAETLGKFR